MVYPKDFITTIKPLLKEVYTAYETFDNEVDRDRRTEELRIHHKDMEIVCTNEDNDNLYILKYTIEPK